MPSTLTKADVEKLLNNPTVEARSETAAKVASAFGEKTLREAEREIAEDIFRVMVRDVEVRVREALSEHLQSCPDVPHDVALNLAQDVDSVSLPMLKSSEVLTDDDLIRIIQSNSETKQIAVAQRPKVSGHVAGALIETRNERAVAKLLSNSGADLDDDKLNRVMTDYHGSDLVSESLARRPNLPTAVAEQLVSALTRQLGAFLEEKADLPSDKVSNLLLQARERATMGLLSEGSTDAELETLIDQLHENDRLTPSIVLRALCMGDMRFFESAMGKRAGIPVQNARILIHDKGTLGLESIYLRATMPEELFEAVRVGVELSKEADYDCGDQDRERYIERMLERILTQCEDPSERIGKADIEYLMTKLQELAA